MLIFTTNISTKYGDITLVLWNYSLRKTNKYGAQVLKTSTVQEKEKIECWPGLSQQRKVGNGI